MHAKFDPTGVQTHDLQIMTVHLYFYLDLPFLFSTIFALSESMTWFSLTEWSQRAEPHISLSDCLFLSLVYTVVKRKGRSSTRHKRSDIYLEITKL